MGMIKRKKTSVSMHASHEQASHAGMMGEKSAKQQLGWIPLSFIVVGSMIGGGAFSLSGDMSAGANTGAVLIGWLITGIGIIALALAFQNLAVRKPELNGGIYSYARAGFGEFLGFSSAWGYWLSAWLGNIAYMTLLFSALSYFFPVFGEGNNLASVIGASIIVWTINWLVLRGVKEAALVNTITTIAKIIPILLFIVIGIFAFHADLFFQDFWGSQGAFQWGSVLAQVKSTMLVTLWVFIGVEGAVVLSARAKTRQDVGRATMAGLLGTLLIYVLISLVSMGIMSQPQLAELKSPSMAYVLEQVVGPWGAAVINIGLIISLLGATLGWTLLAVEIPYVAAKDHVFPEIFAKDNEKGAPSSSLWVTNGLVQLFLILILFSSSSYQALYSMATSAILLPYLFSALYQLKLAWTGETYQPGEGRTADMTTGVIATLYAVWLVYAAGWSYLLLTTVLYAVGIVPFVLTRKKQGKRMFTKGEGVLAAVFVIMALIAIDLIAKGVISLVG